MNKAVLLIFQDCPDCGEREQWYKKQKEIAKANGLRIQPTPYTKAKDIILEAKARGVKNTLLFYTDGKKCGYDIRDFIPQQKKTKEPEANDGLDTES